MSLTIKINCYCKWEKPFVMTIHKRLRTESVFRIKKSLFSNTFSNDKAGLLISTLECLFTTMNLQQFSMVAFINDLSVNC